MKVWVMHGRTESGDDVGPYVFSFEPTKDQQVELLKRDWPAEFEGDPEYDWIDGDFGYITTLHVEGTEVISP